MQLVSTSVFMMSSAVLLALAVAVDVGKGAALVVEDLLRTEETGHLDGSVLHRVGGVDDVLLVAHGVVAKEIGGTGH